MNVGDPTRTTSPPVTAGVGDAHSSDEARKGKIGKSEGALL